MRGQPHRGVLERKLQRQLRNAPTDAELRLWYHVRRRNLLGCKFRRQHPWEDYVLDFVCIERRVVIEVDGGQHAGSARDAQRDQRLQDAGFIVLRFWNDEVLTRTEDVLERILAALAGRGEQQNHPHPGPPLEGEGEQRDDSRRPSRENHPHPGPPFEGEGERRADSGE
jgi:very-short-patch-repair endonuclease